MSRDASGRVEDLWQDYTTGRDVEDRNRLVVHYAPLVKYVAGRFASTLPRHIDVDDLLSDGTIGLVRAVERYDPGRGVDFAAFAVTRIRGAMTDGLRALDWLPRSVRAQVKELETCAQRLQAGLGRPPTAAEVAEALGTDVGDVRARERHRDEGRQVPMPDEGVVAGGMPAEHRAVGAPEERLPPVLVRELRRMPERDQALMALYYYERLTMAEIGTVLGVSESRVSQLHHRIKSELRERVTQRPPARGAAVAEGLAR